MSSTSKRAHSPSLDSRLPPGPCYEALAEQLDAVTWLEPAGGGASRLHTSASLLARLGGVAPDAPGWIDHVLAEDRGRVRDARAEAEAGCDVELRYRVQADRGARWVCERHIPVREDGGRIVGRHVTVTELEEAPGSAGLRAVGGTGHDGLTGLPNRARFEERLSRVVAALGARPVAVLCLGVGGLQAINESYGYAAGDSYLRAVARRVTACVRSGDEVARIGGDEFAVLIADAPDRGALAAVAEKLAAALAEPVRIGDDELFIDACIGVAVHPDDAATPKDLVCAADAAMYREKPPHRIWQFYGREMAAESRDRLSLSTHLHRALERGELSLHYQPVFDVEGEELLGVEALLRWHSAELGEVSPGRFIPVAEESGLIVPIGAWVLRAACAQWVAWRDAGGPDLELAVNISVKQFRHRGLAATVAAAVAETGMDPRRLVLEITESAAMGDVEHAVEVLDSLRALGVRIAIDDFGTGWSSLAYLEHLPVDILKIDRSFVRNLHECARSEALVAAVVTLGHGLGLEVVAEGVEVEAQLLRLAVHGCDRVQGFLYGRPVPPSVLAERFPAWAQSA